VRIGLAAHLEGLMNGQRGFEIVHEYTDRITCVRRTTGLT
jgi:hypothetical protein